MTPACDQCRYFYCRSRDPEEEHAKPTIEGECRRRPPEVGRAVTENTLRTEYRLGVFPRVLIFDWCGEFESRFEKNTGLHQAACAEPLTVRTTELDGLGGPNTSLKDTP